MLFFKPPAGRGPEVNNLIGVELLRLRYSVQAKALVWVGLILTGIQAALLILAEPLTRRAFGPGNGTSEALFRFLASMGMDGGGTSSPLLQAAVLEVTGGVGSGVGFCAVLAVLAGALIVSTGFATGAAAEDLLIQPNRTALFGARLGALALAGGATAVVAWVIRLAFLLVSFAITGGGWRISAGFLICQLIGGALSLAVLAALGGALGFLIRSPVLVALVVLVWAFVELVIRAGDLVLGLYLSMTQFLPLGLPAMAWGGPWLVLDYAMQLMSVLLVQTVLISAVALTFFKRRDIT
ncbi:MAG: hypothetical protein LBJ62_01870 [Bifidobacteriaceae bacterium]|jgi:hypothetical protein|nr:hypothetical protein [Bifidobacteriaceae bacterium]